MKPQEKIEIENRLESIEKRIEQITKYLKSTQKKQKVFWRCRYCNRVLFHRPINNEGCSCSPNGKHLYIQEIEP